MDELSLPAKNDSLYKFLDFILDPLPARGFDEETCGMIRLACEEALVNVINYAYPDGKGLVTVCCSITGASGDELLTIEIADSGDPFDPLAKEDPDLTISLEDRPIGGLGIFLIKNIMTEVHYTRREETNVLTLTKKRVIAEPES